MKIPLLLSLVASARMLHAGVPVDEDPGPAEEPWITPTLDIRTRYEFGEIDGLDPSHALTVRERIGLKSRSWNGFSALIEGEFLQALVDDYSAGAPGADPFDPSNTGIADPETFELNQAYLQYSGHETVGRLGRMGIAYDNLAFVNSKGWRQNEQTFDGISLTHTPVPGLALNYAYINQVNRMFGSEADAPLIAGPPPFDNVQDVAANVHLFNGSLAAGNDLTLGAYAYLMEFRDTKNWDNRTFGGSIRKKWSGFEFYGEGAWQDQAGFRADGDGFYGHLYASRELGSQTLTLGIENLDAGFKMPLGTPHPFNGFADVFAFGRMEGTHNGLTDVYLSHSMPLWWGIRMTNYLRALGDNEVSAGYGWEYDMVLSKKLDEHLTVVSKFSHFEAGEDPYVGTGRLRDTARFSVELNFVY